MQAQDSTATKPYVHETTGFLDFNAYYDTRHFSVATINILSKLPNRFEYFSLTNFQGSTASSDLSTFFTEQNIRWKPFKQIPVQLTAQGVFRDGENNDNFYLGFLWKPGDMPVLAPLFKRIHLFYFLNAHLVKISEASGVEYFRQLEHVYKLSILPKLLHNRVYIAGFADQNFIYQNNSQDNNKLSFNWVSEHQLGVMLFDHFYLVTEYRINDFLPANKTGFGYGLQYIVIY